MNHIASFSGRLSVGFLGCATLLSSHGALAQGTPAAQPTPVPAADSPTPTATGSAPSDAPSPTPAPSPTDGVTETNPTTPPPPVSAPPPPPASESEPRAEKMRVELGGRLGYGMPLGNVQQGEKLKDVFSATIPAQFDAWLRVPGGFAFGVYIGLAAGISGKALDACGDCSAFNYRFGLQAARHFNSGGTVDPWLGVGLGAEFATITQNDTSAGINYKYDYTYSALPEVLLQGGVDIGSDTLAFGPFASISYASYSKVSATLSCTNLGCGDGVTSKGDVQHTSGHSWLMLGIRGTYLR